MVKRWATRGLVLAAFYAASANAHAAFQNQMDASLKDDLQKALFSTASFDGLSVKAQKTSAGLWVLYVAAKDVGWNSGTTDGSEHSEATVVAGWYDAENKLMGNLAQEESFKRVIPGGDAVYSMQVVAPAGAVRLRFVVRDAINGRMGTVDLQVQGVGNRE